MTSFKIVRINTRSSFLTPLWYCSSDPMSSNKSSRPAAGGETVAESPQTETHQEKQLFHDHDISIIKIQLPATLGDTRTSSPRLFMITEHSEGVAIVRHEPRSAVCQLNKLTHLALTRNKKIKEIPRGACGKMKGLRELYMVGCGLTCLPEDLNPT